MCNISLEFRSDVLHAEEHSESSFGTNRKNSGQFFLRDEKRKSRKIAIDPYKVLTLLIFPFLE